MKRTDTDCFLESNRRSVCANFVTINSVDCIEIEISNSSAGDEWHVCLTTKQARQLAQQLLEMCDD